METETANANKLLLSNSRVGGRFTISRTPLRISFVGGGTDIPEYYRHNGGGAVVNVAINRYVYIIVNKKFDNQVRVSYSVTEIVPTADEVSHPLVREALRLLDIHRNVEIVSISDIPSHGTGLGSSSSFTVGLLNALHSWLGEEISPKRLAEEAVRVERDVVGDPGGKQDQYIAAFGGLRFMEFFPDDEVGVKEIRLAPEAMDLLQRCMMLFYTGKTRAGAPILSAQIAEMRFRQEEYHALRSLAYALCDELEQNRVEALGEYLHRAWEHKRRLHEAISDWSIDQLYLRARAAGAEGGKVTGAGGGGFLLLFAQPERQPRLRSELAGLQEEVVSFDHSGSRILDIGK